MKVKTILRTSILSCYLLCLSAMAMAVPAGPGPDPDPAIPLDLGLTAFVAAGVGYAIKRRRDMKKTHDTDSVTNK